MAQARSTHAALTTRPLQTVEDFDGPWDEVDVLTLPVDEKDRYCVGFARSTRAVERALRLRYEVFNLELNEGLDSSAATGLDRDEYDDQMTHLILVERSTDDVVGTYRIQTGKHARFHNGFYSANEYDLTGLEPYFNETLEAGRACLAVEHRAMRAIMGLWKGLGAYMKLYGQIYLFGCCSLTTQDSDDGWRALKTIRDANYIHSSLFLPACETHTCGTPDREFEADLGEAVPLPKLFRTYMLLGAKVVSEPAIDRAFGTVDFLVMLDARDMTYSQLDIVK